MMMKLMNLSLDGNFMNHEAEDAVMDTILLSVNSSCNDISGMGESYFDQFIEWLEEYTGYSHWR